MNRLGFRLLAALALCLAFLPAAQASEDYPAKVIKLVVPYPPGGPLDAFTRQLADRLGKRMKTTVIVDNKAGGLGVIGAESVARSAADGYTLLSTSIETHVNNVAIFKQMPFDVNKDFAPVSQMLSLPVVFACNARNTPANSFSEFIAVAQKESSKGKT